MPSYSFGHRWVGVISGANPPPLPTLMAMAKRRDKTPRVSGTSERARASSPIPRAGAQQKSPGKVRPEVWATALFDVIGPDDLRRFDRARDRCQQSLVRQRRASGRRGEAQRQLRKLKQRTDAESLAARKTLAQEAQDAIRANSEARAETTAAIAEMESIVFGAREVLVRMSAGEAGGGA